MVKLKELIGVLTLNKVKSIEIIDQNVNPDSMLMKLYIGIRNEEFKTDESAWQKLYPNSKNKNAFYKLKHTLKERLFNSLFFIDVKSNKFSDIHSAKIYLQKLTSLINILRTKGLKKNAIDMAKKGLKIAETYQFSEEKLIFLKALRSHYALMKGNQTTFEKYQKQAEECSKLINSETIVEGIVQEIMLLYTNDKSTKTHIYENIQSKLISLDSYKPAKPSINWIFHYSMIEISGYLCKNDYREGLAVCEKALEEIKKLSFVHTSSLISISVQAVSCCMQLNQFKKGEQLLIDGIKIMQAGIFNWFKYHELYVMLCFHSGQYEKASHLYSKSTNHPNFSTLPENAKEVWKIHEAWIYFLGKATIIEKNSNVQKFKTSRYLNELPIYSKDKSGLNIAIIVSKIAIFLIDKKFENIIDEKEAIHRYKDRYIDNKHNLRSKLFINILLKIPSANFKRTVIKEKSKKEIEMLNNMPIEKAFQSADIEIFPYEKLWKILLNGMEP